MDKEANSSVAHFNLAPYCSIHPAEATKHNGSFTPDTPKGDREQKTVSNVNFYPITVRNVEWIVTPMCHLLAV